MAALTSIQEAIGGTPLVYLRNMAEGLPARVAVKLESNNPGGSVKDRPVSSMLRDAEERGLVEPERTVLVEPTSGNTGIALAMLGAARGYRVVLTMPESMSVERRRLLVGYGAELVLTPAGEGMSGAVQEAARVAETEAGGHILGQFTNPANPRAHYETTGPELVEALGAENIGAFVAGVGTGGTISGAGRYLKERTSARTIAVEPTDSPVVTQTLAGDEVRPAPHLIQGIGAGFVPDTLDLDVVDEVVLEDGDRAIEYARRLAAEEGLMVGISSGANVDVALQVAARPELEGSVVVTIACSTGERYLSTALFDGIA
jgi:cysteine synthase A